MSFLCVELLECFPHFWRVFAAGALALILVWFAFGEQITSYEAHSVESLRYQNLAPIFSYLRVDAPAQSVVLADSYLSTRLTIYTQDFAYMNAGYGSVFQVPQDRVTHDYFVLLRLRGVTGDSVRSYVYQKNNREEIGTLLFIGTHWRDLCGSYGCFPDSVLESLIPQYQAFVLQPLLVQLKKYKIDYILWDSKLEPDWKLLGIVRTPPVYQSGDFILYVVK
jgi:hypothetical protein